MPKQSILIFYVICGLIVAWMLFRIWRKNRATKLPVIPPRRPAVKSQREPVPPAPAPAPVIDPAPPMPLTYSVIPESPGRDSTAAKSTSTKSSSPPEPAIVPATITPVSSVAQSMKDADTPSTSWDDRRLFEIHGLAPRNTNTMPRVLPEEVPGVDDSDRVFGPLLNPVLAAMLPDTEERREEARRDLMSAGYYNPHALENLAAVRYFLMVVSVLLFGLLLLVVPPQLEPWMVAGCVLGPLLAWALPSLYVRGKARERKHEIERAMPDLLDMLNMCVGQGLTVPDSLLRVGRDFRSVYPALSQELGIVTEQSRISNMHTALENFSRRVDLPEVHSLTTLLIQTERMGTSISQALITYSDTMRESQRQQADEKGNRATFRLLFPTVLCLMPAVYLFLLGPAFNELQKFFYGGGADSLSSGSQIVQRVNATRNRGRNPAQPTAPLGR